MTAEWKQSANVMVQAFCCLREPVLYAIFVHSEVRMPGDVFDVRELTLDQGSSGVQCFQSKNITQIPLKKEQTILSVQLSNQCYYYMNELIVHFCSNSHPVVSSRPQFHCCYRTQSDYRKKTKHTLIIIWISHITAINISKFLWYHTCCQSFAEHNPLNLLKCTCHVMYFSHSFQSTESQPSLTLKAKAMAFHNLAITEQFLWLIPFFIVITVTNS